MEEEKGLANIAVGICVIGCIVAGITSVYGGIEAIHDRHNYLGSGVLVKTLSDTY